MNRDLSEKEKKTIRDMNLSPLQEEEVRKAWKEERAEQQKWYLSPLIILLELIVVATFVANLLSPSSLIASAVNLAVFLTWIYVIVIIIMILGLIISVCGNPFGHLAMRLVQKTGTTKMLLARIILVAYIVAMVLNGYLFTASALVVAVIIFRIVATVAKEEVKKELNKIDPAA